MADSWTAPTELTPEMINAAKDKLWGPIKNFSAGAQIVIGEQQEKLLRELWDEFQACAARSK